MNKFTLSLSATKENIDVVRSIINTLSDIISICREDMNDLKTCVTEVFTNCVKHAYPNVTNKEAKAIRDLKKL